MSIHISSLKFLYSNLFSETGQMSEASDEGGLVDYEKNSDEIESLEVQPLPEGLEDLGEESVKAEDIVLLTEPERGLGDVEETKEDVELSSEEGISVIIMTPCEEHCVNTETVLELESKQKDEPGLTQESDPPQPGVLPDLVCNAVEIEDSVNVELTIIVANDEILELENAEAFVERKESVLEVELEEPTCEEQNESTVEVELDGHKEQLIQQSDCSDELENSKESEGSKQSISNETETSEQASPTKSTDDVEKSPNEAELLDQSERSTEIETSQLFESKDSKETNQPDKLQQTEQENHTNSEEHQNHDHVRQTEVESSEHVPEEQQEESLEPVAPYKTGHVGVVDREEACRLAERLYRLDNVQRTDVVRHLDKE